MLVDTSSSFLLSKVLPDETFPSSSLVEVDILDKISSILDDESFENRSSGEIFFPNETTRVIFFPSSLNELFDEVAGDSSRF